MSFFSQPQQQQQQQQPAAGGFSFGQPQQQQQAAQNQQQRPLFGANPATPGPLSVNDLNKQPQQQQPQMQQQQQPGGFGFGFGQQQAQAQQQPQQPQQQQQQPGFQPFGARPGQAGAGGHPGLHHSASSGSLYGSMGADWSSTAAQSIPVYVPGYLSKIRSNKPYASNRRVSGNHSPTHDDDANTSRDVDGRGGPTSPTHPFQSSFFFSSRSPTADDRAGSIARSESIFGPGGLRGTRRSVGPGVGAGGAQVDDGASLRGSVGPGGLRRSASGAFGTGSVAGRDPSVVPMDDDDDLPPVQALREGPIGGVGVGNGMAVDGISGGLGASRTSVFGASTVSRGSPAAGPNAALSGNGLPANGATASTRYATQTLLIFGFPAASKPAVLHFLESIGEILVVTPVSSLDYASSGNGNGNGGGEGSNGGLAASVGTIQYDALQITYAEPWCALRALRRNGDIVAGAGCRIGIRFANENLHREVVQNGINSPVLASAQAAVLASGGDVGEAPGRPSATSAPTTTAASENKQSTLNVQSASTTSTNTLRKKRESTPAIGRPISMVTTPSLVLRTPGSGSGSGSASAQGSPFAKAAASLFGGGASGTGGAGGAGARAATASPHTQGRHSIAAPPSSLFRSALSNSPAPAQSGAGAGSNAGAAGGSSAGALAPASGASKGGSGSGGGGGGGLGQRLSDAIFGW